MRKLLLIACFGALGTLARYGLGGLVQRDTGGAFPWGTLAVNWTGCFLFGLVWAFAESRLSIGGEVRTIILVGFIGAFTTFSTFAFETGEMLRDAQWGMAAGNILLQCGAGLACLFLGMALGRNL